MGLIMNIVRDIESRLKIIFDALIWQKLIWLTQSANVWVYQGNADETVSGRSYRLRKDPIVGKFWGTQQRVIDWIFLKLFGQENHCQKAHYAELVKRDMLK